MTSLASYTNVPNVERFIADHLADAEQEVQAEIDACVVRLRELTARQARLSLHARVRQAYTEGER